MRLKKGFAVDSVMCYERMCLIHVQSRGLEDGDGTSAKRGDRDLILKGTQLKLIRYL